MALLAACSSPVPRTPEPEWFSVRDDGAVGGGGEGRSLALVVGCTIRVDQTSLAGGPPSTTPFLSSLAAEGAWFEDAVSAAPWTRPATTALLTGAHARGVGMADLATGPDGLRLPDDVATLASHLRAAGWTTVGVVANPNVSERFGLDRGFERWREPSGTWGPGGVKLPGAYVLDEVREATASLPPGPVLLLVVLVDAHHPIDPSPEELAAFADPAVPADVVEHRVGLARFDAAASLVVGVARERLGPEALVAVVSDHGDGLSWPSWHGPGHGRYLAPSSARMLWLLSGTGVPRGRRISELVSQVDVAPTLAALVGAPFAAPDGRDRSGLLFGDGGGGEVVYVDTAYREVDRSAAWSADVACQADFGGGAPTDGFVDACFDRRADPTFSTPLADPPEDLLRAVHAYRARAARSPVPARPDAELSEQLRALGYE